MMRSGQTSHRYDEFFSNPKEGIMQSLLNAVDRALNQGQPVNQQSEQQEAQAAPRSVLELPDDEDISLRPNQDLPPSQQTCPSPKT